MSDTPRALASLLFILSAVPASAQSTASPATPLVAPLPAVPASSVLRAGTPVPLKVSEALSTDGKKLRVGYRFQLETAGPVTVDGRIVIPAGSPVTGEVTDVRNKGMWGKSGRINARVLFVRANGRQIRMTGQLDDKGVTGTAGVVGSVLLVPVVGFFVTGTSAKIPLGAPVNGFIDEDVVLAFASEPVAPMIVAPAPNDVKMSSATAATAPAAAPVAITAKTLAGH